MPAKNICALLVMLVSFGLPANTLFAQGNQVYSLNSGQGFANGQTEYYPPVVSVQEPAHSHVQPAGYFQHPMDSSFQTGSNHGSHFHTINRRNSHRQWFANVEATFLRPSLDQPNTSGFVYDSSKVIGAVSRAWDVDSFYAAPRVEIATRKQNRGLEFRFWQMQFNHEQYVGPSDFTTQGTPTSIGTTYDNFDFDVYSLEFDFVRHFQVGRTAVEAGVGPRFLELETASYTHASDILAGNQLATIDFIDLIHYDGLGIAGGLKGVRPLGRGWNLYWKGRGSGIFGNYFHRSTVAGGLDSSTASAQAIVSNTTTSTATTATGSGRSRANATAPTDDNLYILESELGLRYSRPLHSIPATGFFSFGFEYQYWGLPDGYTDATLVIGAGTLSAPGPVRSASISLTGFNVSAGITY